MVPRGITVRDDGAAAQWQKQEGEGSHLEPNQETGREQT